MLSVFKTDIIFEAMHAWMPVYPTCEQKMKSEFAMSTSQ